MTRSPLALLLAAALAPTALPQALVKLDLEPSLLPDDAQLEGFAVSGLDEQHVRRQAIELGGCLYFRASVPDHGWELWRSDGTPGGTSMVLDLAPGPEDGCALWGAKLGGQLWFVGFDGVQTRVYRTDGTAAGTAPEPFPVAGEDWIEPERLVTNQGQLFLADDPGWSSGRLWVTDGTPGGCVQILPAWPSLQPRSLRNLIAHPGGPGVLFSGRTVSLYGEAWVSDGTPAGTLRLTQAFPSSSSIQFESPVAVGGRVVFGGQAYTGGHEPYVTDGTVAGTKLLADLNPGPEDSDPELDPRGSQGGILYFTAEADATGRELYRTDGTPAGTWMVLDSVPGHGSSYVEVLGFAGGELVVEAYTSKVGHEPHVLRGGELTALANLNPGTLGTYVTGAAPMGSELAFTAWLEGEERLVITDGTSTGTRALPTTAIRDPEPPLGTLPDGSALLAGDPGTQGIELMRTFGTVQGTALVKELNPGSVPVSSYPSWISSPNGSRLTLFVSQDRKPAYVGWSEGTGTFDLAPLPGEPLVYEELTPAWLGDQGAEVGTFGPLGSGSQEASLYGTFGDQGGHESVPGSKGGMELLAGNGHDLLLFGYHAVHGPELWISDGTGTGTAVIGDLLPATVPWSSRARVIDDDYLVWIPEPQLGLGIWRTDGTVAGTQKLVGGLEREQVWYEGPVELDGVFYFLADDGTTGVELWRTDGTVAGTHLVVDVLAGPAGSDMEALVRFGDRICFFARDVAGGPKALWSSDGTAAGTVKVGDANLLPGIQPVAADGWLYFACKSSVIGKELWAWDGTTVSLVAELVPGKQGCWPSDLTPCGSRVFFRATTPETGYEVFLGDAAAGTVTGLPEPFPGPQSSDPQHLTLCDGDLYFAATDATGDRELFRYDLDLAHALDLGAFGAVAELRATAPVRGGTIDLSVTGMPAGSTGFLAWSPPVPDGVGGLVADGSPLLLDPAGVVALGFGQAPGWSATFAVPHAPVVQGLELHLQALVLQAGQLPATSNALRLVFGN